MRETVVLKALRKFGLPEKEATVYVVSLGLGPSTVQTIAKKTKINRSTTYLMIEELIRQGLMSATFKGKRKYFTASRPHNLRYIQTQKSNEIEMRENLAEHIINILEISQGESGGSINIETFDGPGGTKIMQQLCLETNSIIREVCNLEVVRQHLPPVFTGDIRKRISLKTSRNLMEGVPDFEITKPTQRIVNKDRHICAEVDLIDDSLFVIISYSSEEKIISIKNGQIANTARSLFDALYDETAPLV